ncbi:inositol monophosphatase family protein [Leptospira langatensis]|uniref:Inositol monophosphatase family protein n=1 Tax=Leptospira langatensis TaxID=2484983 RepID=A0A5F1ZT63_9LEPT|nr:inositol monophosphatase family protein [Leptospira langatensis]TGK02860.1 inositol monophosphatase family protein [Leptospira langatensis]TGL41614.1 inositol monophosphatase family protein [Leptospira langatensis]
MVLRSDILDVFRFASKQAGSEILKLFNGSSEYDLKDPMQVLTEADLRSHQILEEILNKEFPGLSFVMEEQENPEPLPKTCVVCDELDGTALFSRGMKEFSVILSFLQDGSPYAGCIYYPCSDQFLLSEKGKGTFIGEDRIRLSRGGNLDRCILSLEINNTFQDSDYQWISAVSKRALATRALAATGAGFLELLEGKTDLFMNLSGAKVWDFAAGVLALEEAGGSALDKNGEPLAWDKVRMSAILGRDANLVKEVYRYKP